MVERRSPKPDVEGSSPSGREFINKGNQMNEAIESTIESIKTYFRGVRSEWGKITWPERGQVIGETAFVVAIIFAFTLAVYLMDIFYKWVFGFIHS